MPTTTRNRPSIGQQAVLNGRKVIWSGDDYSWQSPESFNQLKQQGQLALGSSLVRRGGQLLSHAEQLRHRLFGTDQRVVQAVQQAEIFISTNTVARVADQGASFAGQAIAQRLGISLLLGALILGSVVPGGGPSGPRRAAQARRAAHGVASDPQTAGRAQAATNASPLQQGPRTRAFNELVQSSDLSGDTPTRSSVGSKSRMGEGQGIGTTQQGVRRQEAKPGLDNISDGPNELGRAGGPQPAPTTSTDVQQIGRW